MRDPGSTSSCRERRCAAAVLLQACVVLLLGAAAGKALVEIAATGEGPGEAVRKSLQEASAAADPDVRRCIAAILKKIAKGK